MEPVEINAGTCYLRQLRSDDRIDDRQALVEAGPTIAMPDEHPTDIAGATAYVEDRARQWQDDECYSWVIAELTTGALVGEVTLADLDHEAGTARLTAWSDESRTTRETEDTAVNAALRFASGALGLSDVSVRRGR